MYVETSRSSRNTYSLQTLLLTNVFHIQFQREHFTVSKIKRQILFLSEDQAREQNIRVIKETGGNIGIIDSHRASLKRMISGPVISKLSKILKVSILRQILSLE